MWVLPVRCNLCPRQPRVKGKIARAALYDMLGGSATQERPPFEYKFSYAAASKTGWSGARISHLTRTSRKD